MAKRSYPYSILVRCMYCQQYTKVTFNTPEDAEYFYSDPTYRDEVMCDDCQRKMAREADEQYEEHIIEDPIEIVDGTYIHDVEPWER